MVWLPDGEKISKICLFVLAQLANVTDGQTDRQTDGRTPHADMYRAYAYASRGKYLSTTGCLGKSGAPTFYFGTPSYLRN